jgi:hypothetical protein
MVSNILFKWFLVAVVFAAVVLSGTTAMAQDSTSILHGDTGITAEGSLGLRRAAFPVAPRTQELWLDEVQIGGRYRPSEAYPIAFGLRTFGQSMRGELAPGLTELSAVGVGPQIVGDFNAAGLLGSWSRGLKFKGALAYDVVFMRGKGTDNWDDQPAASRFLLGTGTVNNRSKTYSAHGPSLGLASTYAVTQAFAVGVGIEAANQTLYFKDNVIENGVEMKSGGRDNYLSRAAALIFEFKAL